MQPVLGSAGSAASAGQAVSRPASPVGHRQVQEGQVVHGAAGWHDGRRARYRHDGGHGQVVGQQFVLIIGRGPEPAAGEHAREPGHRLAACQWLDHAAARPNREVLGLAHGPRHGLGPREPVLAGDLGQHGHLQDARNPCFALTRRQRPQGLGLGAMARCVCRPGAPASIGVLAEAVSPAFELQAVSGRITYPPLAGNLPLELASPSITPYHPTAPALVGS
jgi:hypothetical protein